MDGMRFPSLDGEPRRSGRDVSGGSALGCSLYGPRGGTLLLARFVILEVVPSIPVSGSIPPVLLGLRQREQLWEKARTELEDGGGGDGG